MRTLLRHRVLGIGIAILACGCRDRSGQPEARAAWTSQNPHDRFRQDAPMPFAPIPGEVAPAQPCGPNRRGPCLLLGWEFYNWAWGYAHTAWFMDTDGNEYEFSSGVGAARGPTRPEDMDAVRMAMSDQVVSQDDFARIVAASTARPLRVTAADVGHARSLLAASRTGSVETVRVSACNDGGGSALSGYLFAPDRKGSSPLMLEEVECDFLLKGNTSDAARELAQWVHQLRGTVRPYRARE
jgi:hypothetical protein